MHRVAVWLIPALALAQSTPQPEPRELVRQSAEALKTYQSYRMDSLSVIEMRGAFNNRMEMPTSVSVRRPDRMRIESRNQVASMTVVSDGDHTFIYLAPVKQYIERAASSSPDTALGESGLMKNLPDISKAIQSVTIAGEETVPLDGEAIPCWIVETRYGTIELPEQKMTIMEAVQNVWIAKSNHVALRSKLVARLSLPTESEPVEMTQSTTTVLLKLKTDQPDSLFVFTPPAGSTPVPDWSLPGVTKPDVIGKPVPALIGKTLGGAAIDLATLRGKVVLLDFWTTWCAPCRRDLPVMEKLSKEFRGRGLVVVGVNVDEEKDTVAKFLQTMKATYPMVQFASDHPFVSGLSVTAFPTVVLVDKTGKVAAYEVGSVGETALRAELAKLGLRK